MEDLHFQKAIDALEDSGLELFPEDRKVLAAAPPAARPHLVGMLQRALVVGTPATPSTVVRYRGPSSCSDRLTADHAPATGRHAKDGA